MTTQFLYFGHDGCSCVTECFVLYNVTSILIHATAFTRFMSEGKMRAALHMLSSQSNNSSLALNTLIDSVSVKKIVQKKHPPAQLIDPTTLISYEDPIE